MKIGISDLYLDSLGGGEKYMLTAAICLAEKHAVSLFWDDASILTQAQKRFGTDFSPLQVTKNIFTKDISFFQKLKLTKNYDAIIYLSDGSIPLTLTKKLIIHFQFPVEWIQPDLKTKIKLQRVNTVVCNSQFTKEFIDRKFGINSTVIYPPIRQSMIKKHVKENVILTVGRYNVLPEGGNFKKLDVMITAFKKMIDTGVKGWKFIMVVSFKEQDKKYIAQLEKLAKGYPIVIRKNIEAEELDKCYSIAKIYWHAAGYNEDLSQHPERAEHFGMATSEAMRDGAVPVVIDAGGQKEIVTEGKNGLLWSTEKELIEKTKQVMSNPGLQNTLAKGARTRAKDFSLEMFCQKFTDLV